MLTSSYGRVIAAACLLLTGIGATRAQELTPNAYTPVPVGANLLLLTNNYSTGSISLDPSLPIEDVHANVNTTIVGYGRTLGLFGHYTNIGFLVPYVHGEVSGLIGGQQQSVRRNAFGDPLLRLAVNLYGAPALSRREFASYQQSTIVGVALVVAPPLGAYDSTKLINVGSNRWSFKPEIGISQRTGAWTFESDLAVIFFTDNTNFYNGGVRSQEPIGALQLHAIYTIRPQMWVAVDANYYTGGRTTVNGKQNVDLQQNSRVGITFGMPLTRAQSLKFAYSHGARTTIGGDFDTFGISYQYAWFSGP
jgi:hypothetical protein